MTEKNDGNAGRKKRKRPPVAWQNKDVSSKVLAEQFKGQDMSVFGLKLPRIVDVQPTNLPAVEANELRIDNLFTLEDGSYMLIDYESSYSEKNKVKYLSYLARIAKRLYNIHKKYPKIRLVIIYTSDVERGSTIPMLDMGAVKMELTEIFLVDMDGGAIKDELQGKLKRGESLSDEELTKLVIYPLTFKGREAKMEATHEAIKLADKLKDAEKEMAVMKLLLAFTDKVISKEDRKWIREVITMSGVERMIEQEKQKAVKEAVDETAREKDKERKIALEKKDKEREKALEEKEIEKEGAIRSIALNFLRKGSSADDVADSTGLPLSTVMQLKEALV